MAHREHESDNKNHSRGRPADAGGMSRPMRTPGAAGPRRARVGTVGRRATGAHRARGASLVEASIASLMFFTVLLGLFEFGWAFRDYMTTADLARNAARSGSAAGNSGTADYVILQAVKKSNSALNNGQLQYVVVFDAGSATGTLAGVSATCLAGTSVANVCNVYTAADLSRPASDFGCNTSLPSPDRFWCPSTRKIAASVSGGGPPSFLGVYVKVHHNAITKALGSGVDFKDQAVLRLEPSER